MRQYVVGIDQGTTGTYVSLMRVDGQTVSSAYKSHHQNYPQSGWVEQDPEELWQNACELINQVIRKSGIPIDEIAGIGIANQGESVMMWDMQTGRPIHNVLIWQDTRTQDYIEQLATDLDISQEVAQRTGLKLDSYFSASKIRWLLDHIPEAKTLLKNQRLACGTLDTWLIWKMTEGRSFVTDVSTASRTLLMNIHSLEWDEWLLNLFELPLEIFPKILETIAIFGQLSHSDIECHDVPIVVSLVDQPAAMVGQGCLRAGQIKATYGTGCFINLNTGNNLVTSRHGLLTMIAWQRDSYSTYGLDGGVFTAAASLNWLKDKLNLLPAPDALDELCSDLSDSGGVMWIPSQIGLGAPYWDRSMRGAWLGMDLSSSREHLIRAVLEGIAARVAQIVSAMVDDSGMAVSYLRVDGGLTNSQVMMQIQADLLGFPVEVLDNPEATAGGVCALAFRATGLWQTDEIIQQQVQVARTYEPAISEDQRQAFLEKFNQAVLMLKSW